jgi:hypothetical protein
MRKNHETTTLLVAMAAIAATLLAAGTVAALGSNHSAFAHKEYKKSYGEDAKYGKGDKFSKGYMFSKDEKRDGDNIAASKQYLKCIVVGGEDRTAPVFTPGPTTGGGPGITGNSCNNRSPTNTNNDGSNSPESDGVKQLYDGNYGDW